MQKVAALPSGDHSVLTPDGTSKKWNTDPPTSGPHYSQMRPSWGAYTTPLYQAQLVHNLEHGGIFIQYGKDVPQATVDQLKGFYDEHLNGTLLAPLPRLGSKIAMGVWTTSSPSSPNTGTAYLAKCTSFDERPTRRSSRRTSSRARAVPGEHADARHVGRPDDRLKPVAAAIRSVAAAPHMPGLGVEPRRPEGHPILSRARMTSFATPALSRARDGEAYRALDVRGRVAQDIAGVSSSAPTRSGMRIGFVT